ncbi:MAG: hypothetical protein ACP5K7_04625, partial [Verrucomicrobiia bacterium]
MNGTFEKYLKHLPTIVAVLAAFAFGIWIGTNRKPQLTMREPGADRPPGTENNLNAKEPLKSVELIKGKGVPANIQGEW